MTTVDLAAELRRRGLEVAGAPDALILDPRDPIATARELVERRFTADGRRIVVAWRGDVFVWSGSYYAEMESSARRAIVWEFLERAKRLDKDGNPEPFRPTATRVNDVLDAFQAVAHLDGLATPPAWLQGSGAVPPNELLPCRNGLLHLPSRRLYPHSPDFFALHALPYDFDPNAAEPVEWLTFLRDVWPNDPEAIETLQEIVACILSGETRWQKIFLLVGPRRSGKGTIARLIRALLGTVNVAGPTLSSLGGTFGLQPLVGKPLAIISDARLSGRTDMAIIVERLLSISGEDPLTVDRKHRESWTGSLPTRLVILTNELPRLADSSGALAGRFVTLTMSKSWYGQEDHYLLDRILPELPGILNWALVGLDRLRERGRFVIPASSAQAVQELEDLGSPVGAFLRECCVIEPGAEVDIGTLYLSWKRWCEDRGQEHTTTQQVFGRDLRAAVAGLETGDRKRDGNRFRVYVGIRRRTP